jgi:hypothetical protein
MAKSSFYYLAACMIGFVSCAPVSLKQEAPPSQEQIAKDPVAVIDYQIAQLQKQREALATRAWYLSQEAERLLFEDFLAYRSYMIRAERAKAQIAEVDNQIAELQAQRNKLKPRK